MTEISILLVLSLVFRLTGSYFAYNKKADLNKMAEAHGFKTISPEEIPENIEPIKVNSEEELKQIME